MRSSPRRILASACSVTLSLTRTRSAAEAGRRGGAALDDAKDLSPSAFFALLAAVDVSERCREDEEVVEVDVAAEEVAEEVEAVEAEVDWGM